MPWIKSKTSNDDDITFIHGTTDEEVAANFENFLAAQRDQGRTVTESTAFTGEWKVSDDEGFIDIYYVDW